MMVGVDNERNGFVRVIGAFKLAKALVLFGVAAVAFKLVHRDHVEELVRWTSRAGIDPSARFVSGAFAKIAGLDDGRLELAGAAAALYATVFAVEGVGLLLKKQWAEWMTLGVTASFVPFEAYELAHGVTVGRVAALAINAAVLAYLGVRNWKRSHHARGESARPMVGA